MKTRMLAPLEQWENTTIDSRRVKNSHKCSPQLSHSRRHDKDFPTADDNVWHEWNSIQENFKPEFSHFRSGGILISQFLLEKIIVEILQSLKLLC